MAQSCRPSKSLDATAYQCSKELAYFSKISPLKHKVLIIREVVQVERFYLHTSNLHTQSFIGGHSRQNVFQESSSSILERGTEKSILRLCPSLPYFDRLCLCGAITLCLWCPDTCGIVDLSVEKALHSR